MLPHFTAPHVSFVQVGVTHWFAWHTVPLAQFAPPQSTIPPQPSAISPHFAPTPAHVFFVHDAEPHTLAEPPPPHVWPAAQAPVPVPHVIAPPHPSGYWPQFIPAGHCVSGVHVGLPHCPATPPPPHVVPAAHVPHCRTLPQPSPAGPQVYLSEAHVAPMHLAAPHWLATPPPPHVSPLAHVPVPHVRRLPQPSGTVPQFAFSAAHVVGVQLPPPHWLCTPPPPHVCPVGQEPQLAVTPPQPSLCGPHTPG
jgi:hypothetical protein